MSRQSIQHCRACGAPVVYRVPDDGDTRARAVCTACATIHYENPLIVVGTVPYLGDRVLLCKRAIEPGLGCWTLPAGFMEMDESLREGAARETAEEAGAQIRMGQLFTCLSVPRVGQVHFYFLAQMLDTRLAPGPETLQARLFAEAEIAWDDLAFSTVRETLRLFFADRRAGGGFGLHELSLA
ncbi:MAG: NUDIX hydrolase [Burkholderiaceae bacterium]|jgi:ADP-ribose pyrophosphatase YjhB (NUDIX family)|nr:NUDIX hydrolase [Burkholderiaceae bacterium]